MTRYRELKAHFARGRFVGLDPALHVHLLDGSRSTVVTGFNLTSHRRVVEYELDPVTLGIPADATVSGEAVAVDNGRAVLRVDLDALPAERDLAAHLNVSRSILRE